MRISRWTLLWLVVVVVLLAIWIAVLTRRIDPGSLVGFFFGFVFALVVITILAIIGAVFVGMWVSHRILSNQRFTPFEQEMLRMRQEVRELRDRVEAIAARLGVGSDSRERKP